jgi:anti-anti-sigma factor
MSERQYQHIKATTEQGCLVLTLLHANLRGDPLAEEIRKEIMDALNCPEGGKVVIDFRFVESFTTALFRPLLSLLRKLHETKGRMVLCNLRSFVAEVFHATRMTTTSGSQHAPFTEATDLAAAVALLNQT